MSNDTPATPDIPDPTDAVRSAVIDAADHVDIGVVDNVLSDVRGTAHRRRRRRNALVGTAAAATLVVSGAVIVNVTGDSGDGDDLIVSAPVTDPIDESTDTDEPVADEPAPDNDTAPVSEPVEAVPAPTVDASSVGTATAETIAADDSYVQGSYQQMLPWQNGFLAVGQIQADQALPAELSDEINAAFPAEVVEFFEEAGGLPPTIAEATTMLQEAGLFDLVSDVVLNNPEVSDAIYAVPLDEPEQFARLSTDGVEWTDIELDIPADAFGNRRIFSTGDRLAVVSLEYAADDSANAGPMPGGPQATAIVVSSTTDLQTWTVQRSELGETADELPAHMFANTYLNGVAANETGWVASIDNYRDVNYEALLPDDFDRSFMEAGNGWSIYHEPDGLIIETYDAVGASDVVRVSWEEIGFTEAPPGLDNQNEGPGQGSSVWSGTWDGEPIQSVVTDDGYGQIFGFDAGFLRQGQGLTYSTDGTSWTELDRPTDGGWVNSFMAIPGGVLAFVQNDEQANGAYQLDLETLTWSPAEQPAIPDGFSPWSEAANGAVLYTIEDFSQYDDMPGVDDPFVMTIENDGFTLEGLFGSESQSYVVIDKASGDIVASETIDAPFVGEFEFLNEVGEGIEIVSPETGDVITSFNAEQLQASASLDEVAPPTTVVLGDAPADTVVAEEGDTIVYEDPPPGFEEYVQPELNVLATNGEVWINQVLDLPELDTSGELDPYVYGYPNEVVVNNGIVLVSMSNGSFIRLTF